VAQAPVFDRAAFAQRLSEAIESRSQDLSLRQIANRSGLSRTTLTGWLGQERSPNLDTLFLLADTLGYRAEWLLFGIVPADGSTPADVELAQVREGLRVLAAEAAALAEGPG
jgi:transcriptional regulator with XRE-family HTH domain